uniref:NADH dehydrogenase subunit 6 n=1 Tax=Metacrangonyx dominicanus TaxID=1199168 RepID=K7ZWI9_9CRUS|nr:NADH dehydrogenase subunit 6 [Metacrangonyx dominicanus]CCI69365.1 NADH dehydrogenase subunit 6 [Metacrangonyx dominicanus]
MIFLILSFLSYILILIFFYSWHPLFMGVMVALQSILIGLSIYLFSAVSWFSYLLFMIFLSGMMVILIYVSSLASNLTMKYFFLSFKMMMFFMSLFMLFILLYYKNTYFCDNFIDFSNLTVTIFLAGKVYSKEMYLFTLLIICYLLLVLILIVKNSMFTKGPLRSNT